MAFHSLPVSVLCPYDASALPADVVLACQRTHPALAAEHRLEPSDEFVDPRGYLPPGDGAAQGRGLWVARQLCDSLEIATDATGTHVRLFALLDPRPATPS